MAAIPYPSYGDLYTPWATTATAPIVFYIDKDACDSTWLPALAPEFIPGRRQPVWPAEARVTKRRILQQSVAKCYIPLQIRNAPSRCQLQRQKRKMRLHNI